MFALDDGAASGQEFLILYGSNLGMLGLLLTPQCKDSMRTQELGGFHAAAVHGRI